MKKKLPKRIFIIHGWGGDPEEGWIPWLKQELEQKGFEVYVPEMPDTEHPKIEGWVAFLSHLVGKADEQTYFVGHSIGCQTILRYVEGLSNEEQVGGAVFVAGWFTLMNLETQEEEEIARPWLETPIDHEKIRQHTQKFIALFSDDDKVVPKENVILFEQRLGARISLEHRRGHFSGDDGVTELPSALSAMLEIAQ